MRMEVKQHKYVKMYLPTVVTTLINLLIFFSPLCQFFALFLCKLTEFIQRVGGVGCCCFFSCW